VTVTNVTLDEAPGASRAPAVDLGDLALREALCSVDRARADVEVAKAREPLDFAALLLAVTHLFRRLGYLEAVARARGLDPGELAPELRS
jgi:hypothetical protein